MAKKKHILKDKDLFPGYVDAGAKPNPKKSKQEEKNTFKLLKQNITWQDTRR